MKYVINFSIVLLLNFIFMTVNFYGNNNPNGKAKELAIYCYVREQRKTIAISTGEKILPKHWDAKKQKAKPSYTGSPEFNQYLLNFAEAVKKVVRSIRTEDPLTPFDKIKELLMKEFKGKSNNQFFDILNEFIESRKAVLASHTIKKYVTLKNHLIEFESNTGITISLETINSSLLDKLTNYFLSINHSNNTIHKNLEILTTFLRWTIENDYTRNNKFAKYEFVVKQTTPEEIALTKEELNKIINCKSLNDRLEKVKDLFLFQVFTGQRYSDICRFNIEDVRNEVWYIKQAKTGKKMEIPLVEPAMTILQKYKGVLPIISNQKMNSYLKELGKIAGIDETEVITKQVGSKKTEQRFFRYELMKTHTARRTFVSLAGYDNIDKNIVKSFTGHGSDKMLSIYFKKNIDKNKEIIEGVFVN